ncbi:ankyrin repeat and SAM domain-containing protein 3-like [Frankliniella occidentalis]|uniref:Ankyrin repeat and SAM domain-containing protein 3-like n=1 Tax=Frankliniella occidentalis TaxID=133901 RepID=A0A6J1SSM5_FRAOC|nr:ankyrin repeat and SAM domain-containing protein 3-like [Frankliniella occidentalis]XP_026282330.2 ankyrin repeat and SAM domain-containing protein 3-like [Frankliniella occidentalis]
MAEHLGDIDTRWAACIADAEVGAVPLDVHTAASLGDEAVVLEALRADPEHALARNDLGWSPLMFAVWQGHVPLVAALLEAARRCGQDAADDPAVGRLPRSGRTLLMVAARFGYERIASALCKPKNLETRDFRGQTALFHAVRGGNQELIRMLVSRGANVNACDSRGRTVLRLAESCPTPATCQLLRQAGAKLEAAVPVPRPVQSTVHTERQGLNITLASILEGLALQKYLELFQLHKVDLQGFVAMSEDDLRRVGVTKLGPRRKMALEIYRLRSLFGIGEI